ncbi:ras-related protein Rab-33A-like [Salmo salar]|uniref:Ras-related protein Rab-33A-like n=1 Tax=Salmo salar TaxID=8030 RepID=A0A1S3RT56_SALSA|nr:ras-related protein Rab-33A-like [Salmo salar]
MRKLLLGERIAVVALPGSLIFLPPSARTVHNCVHQLSVMANESLENDGGTGSRNIHFTSSVDLSTSLESSVQTRIFKIIVIGDSNVGKTCLTFRFTGGSFPKKTEATIGVDFREKAVEIEGEKIKVQVWDTAGQERFRKSMVEHYYRNVHAVVFVYDVTKMNSFQNLKTWIQECNGHRVSPTVPRVLVGNKCDLVSQIQVPSNTALKFADAHNMLLFETSAKDPKESQNVDSIFMCLACRLKAQKSLLYRDVEREDGRVRLSQETNINKSICLC